MGSLTLLSVVCAFAQTPQTSALQAPPAVPSRTVPLVSDACPVVRPGDKLALDWNPGFEHPGMVDSLLAFSLRFGLVSENGVTVQRFPGIVVEGHGSGGFVSPLGNGYFHIELRVPPGSPPGQYKLIDAVSNAKTFPDYQGPGLPMNNSPVRERYCITIVAAPTAQPSGD